MQGMRAFADGAQAVEGRNAQRGCRIAVRPAADRRFPQVDAHLARDLPGDCVKADDIRGAFERRALQGAFNAQLAALVEGREHGEPPFEIEQSVLPRGADIHLDPRFFGNDVRRRSPPDYSGIHGDALREVGPRRQALDLASQLDYGACPGREIESGVSGSAMRADAEGTPSFSGGFQLAVESGAGLGDQHGSAAPGFGRGKGLRCRTADLFIRVELDDEPPLGPDAEIAQSLCRENEVRHAGLHIEYAGAPQTSFFLAPGHAFERADCPNRIEVPQSQELALALCGDVKRNAQMIPVLRLRVTGNRGNAADGLGHAVGRAVDGVLVAAGGFDFHERADAVHDLAPVGAHVLEDPLRGHAVRAPHRNPPQPLCYHESAPGTAQRAALATAFMSLATFARQALTNFQSTAAIVPSSRYLVRAMVEPLRWKSAEVVLELGPGTGAMTRELLGFLPQDALLLAFEVNPDFVRYLRGAIDDERLQIVEGSAETAAGELRRRGIERVDGVVSSLGTTLMDEMLVDSVFRGIAPFLDENSTITQYQYLSSVRWEGVRPVNFNVRSVLDRYFQAVGSNIVWRNIPPAVVHECRGSGAPAAGGVGESQPLARYARPRAGPAGADFP